MKSILLLAYAVSPTRGSEYSVGWNFVVELCKNNIVHLICGASGEHLGDTVELEDYLKNNPIDNLILYIVKPTVYINKINYLNKKGFGPAFYIAFRLWHLEVLKKAKSILANNKIDIIHQYNPIGFREPGYLWKLGKPFIWGPIGGANFVNPILLKNKSFKVKVFFLLKNIATYLQLNFSNRVKKASQKASRLVFCCSEAMNNFEKYVGCSGIVISEQAIPEISNDLSKIKSNTSFNIIHIGRLNEHKNTRFLLESLSILKEERWHLSIVGDGPLRDELMELAIELDVDHQITWHGFKSREELFNIIKDMDLHALSSLSEANTTVLYETRLFGIPTISLDQNGMHDTLAQGNGILVPVTSYEKTKIDFAAEIERLINNPSILNTLKKKTVKVANLSTWKEKVREYEKIYDEVLDDKC